MVCDDTCGEEPGDAKYQKTRSEAGVSWSVPSDHCIVNAIVFTC